MRWPSGDQLGDPVVNLVVGEAGDAGGVHHLYLIVLVEFGGEGDAPAVGRPGGEVIAMTVVGEAGYAGAVGVHHVNLNVPDVVGVERDAPAIRRPRGSTNRHERRCRSGE